MLAGLGVWEAGLARTLPSGQAARPVDRGVPTSTGNHLLAALSPDDRTRLAADFEEVPLTRGQVLFEPGAVPSHAYFPHEGTMISLVLPLREGRTAETITVGAEGVAGVGMDPTDPTLEAYTRAIVQMPGRATRVATARLSRVASESSTLRPLLSRFLAAALSMALQGVACNASHPVRARLARWLLTASDRAVGPHANALPLTQEFLAEMLGVRRATVSEIVLALQDEGVLRVRRGSLQILDRERLAGVTCECYGVLKQRFARLLPP